MNNRIPAGIGDITRIEGDAIVKPIMAKVNMTTRKCQVPLCGVIVAWTISFGIAFADELPDPILTPGVIDQSCSVETLREGSTATRRHTTAAMKAEAYAKYGMIPHQGACAGQRGCEVDHRVPLEACGADDEANLWPMPYEGPCNAYDKDHLENATKRDILREDNCASRFLRDGSPPSSSSPAL